VQVTPEGVGRGTAERQHARRVGRLKTAVAVWATGTALVTALGGDPATSMAATRRLRFHSAAWALGMLVLTPLDLLIEWQDNDRRGA
jgi:hypothetical protein